MHYVPLLQRPEGRSRCLIAHLGTNKTGSTFIQSAALQNSASLTAAGLHYPTPISEIGYAHHSLVSDLKGPWTAPHLLDYLREIDKSRQHGLLSSEGLVELSWWNLVRLRLQVRRPTLAVLYFRSPAAYLRSVAQEQVKHGWSMFTQDNDDFGDLLMAACRSPDVFPNTRISRLAKRTVRAFGGSRVALVSFDHVVASGIDVAEHFFKEVLGLDVPALDVASADRNPSITLVDREFNRMVNFAISEFGVVPGTWVHSYLQAFRQWKGLPWLDRIVEFRRAATLDQSAGFGFEEEKTARLYAHLFATPINGARIFPDAKEPELEWCDIPSLLRHCPAALSDARAVATDCMKWARGLEIVGPTARNHQQQT